MYLEPRPGWNPCDLAKVFAKLGISSRNERWALHWAELAES